MRPSPPTDDVGDKEEDLQEHVGIELILIEKEEEQGNVDDPKRPAPDVRFCRKPYGDSAGEDAKKFKVAEGIAEGGEEDVGSVEEAH